MRKPPTQPVLWYALSTLLVIFALLSGCSSARRHYTDGIAFEEQGRLEEALYRYAEAVKQAPGESVYRVKFLNARQAAAKARDERGNAFFTENRFAEAAVEFQTASGLDASQPRYAQKAANATRLRDAELAWQEGLALEKGNKLREAASAYGRALELSHDNPEYRTAALRVAALRKSKLDGFELQLKSKQPITLRFRETRLKDIFSVISKLSGINFIFDTDLKDQSVTITLEQGTFHQAVDLLTGMYKLGHRVLNETTMLIYPQSPEKVKQYEDMQVRTFHLNHLDAKKAANLVRTMLQVRRIYISEEANALVVRDTGEVVKVIEKILEAHDLPDAEVVLDVEVIEISDKNAQNVGLLLSNYNVQVGGFSPSGNLLSTSLQNTAATTTTTTTSASIDNLVKAFSIGKFGGYVTVPNAQYNFGKTLANGEVLSNPKIRVKNKEKAKFNVGTRVPITTTTMATTGTTSQVNVQYVDVGVKVNAEPTIQLNNEISIKLSLEVSSIISRESVGGKDSATTVVTIGTRNLDTVMSLKDGETSVIGGLIANSKSESRQKVFLLGDIPLVGPLLSNKETSKDKTELILAITPRLVRGVTVLPSSTTAFNSGKEDAPSVMPPYVSFEQAADYAPAAKPQVSPAPQRPVGKEVEQPSPALVVTPLEPAVPEATEPDQEPTDNRQQPAPVTPPVASEMLQPPPTAAVEPPPAPPVTEPETPTTGALE